MNNQENQAVEIDVFAMLKTLWKRKFSIVWSLLSLPLHIWLQCLFSQEKNTKVLAGSMWSAVKIRTTMP